MSRAGQDTSGVRGYILNAYHFAANNLSLVTILLGVVVIAIGGLGVTQYHEVLGPMIAVFGVTLVLIGGIAYSVLWANRLIARFSE